MKLIETIKQVVSDNWGSEEIACDLREATKNADHMRAAIDAVYLVAWIVFVFLFMLCAFLILSSPTWWRMINP